MQPTILHEPANDPRAGIDRSINQDDDADHLIEGHATEAPRDTASGANAWDKPGLVDNARAVIGPAPAHRRD